MDIIKEYCNQPISITVYDADEKIAYKRGESVLNYFLKNVLT